MGCGAAIPSKAAAKAPSKSEEAAPLAVHEDQKPLTAACESDPCPCIANDAVELEAQLQALQARVIVNLLSGTEFKVHVRLGETVSALKQSLAELTNTPAAHFKLHNGEAVLKDAEILLNCLCEKELTAIRCKLSDKLKIQDPQAFCLQDALREVCGGELDAEISATIATVMSVDTEDALRRAAEERAPSIEIPVGTEIRLYDHDGDDPRDEEDDEEAMPLRITHDLHMVGLAGSSLKQGFYADCGVKDELALIVDGSSVQIEGIVFDSGCVQVVNGGALSATRCEVRGGGWFVQGAGSSLLMDECAVRGSISWCISVKEGASAWANNCTLEDGGCWAPNIEVSGKGSSARLTGLRFEKSQGSSAICVKDGGTLVVDDASLTDFQVGVSVMGENSSATLKHVALQCQDGCCFSVGVRAADKSHVTLEGGAIRNCERAVVAESGANAHISSTTSVGGSVDHDFVQIGGTIHGVDIEAIHEDEPLPCEQEGDET